MNVLSRIDLPSGLGIDTFFGWAERQAKRYELVEGQPALLPWVQLDHVRIVVNLTRLLSTALDAASFEGAKGDFASKVGSDSIRYADLMVIPAGKSGGLRFVDDACLVVDVLSPSTMPVDFGEKLTEYQALHDVRSSVVLSQKPAEAWIWSRDAEGRWPCEPVILDRVSHAIEIGSSAIRLPLNEVYRNVG